MIDYLPTVFQPDRNCTCTPTLEAATLTVNATDCPGAGTLPDSPACRSTVINAIGTTAIDAVIVHTAGRAHRYDGDAAAFLSAAAQLADRIEPRDPSLSTRIRHHPLTAGRDATARAGPVSRLATQTGLTAWTTEDTTLDTVLTATVGPQIASSRIDPRPPTAGELIDRHTPSPYTDVRIYDHPHCELPTYHVDPPSTRLTDTDCTVLDTAEDLLALGAARGGVDIPAQAIGDVPTDPDTPPEELTRILEKHTRGFGVLEDFFADDTVSDVYAPAPVATTPLRVTAGGESMHTNVYLTQRGGAALASRLRRVSANAFSRSTPTIDADITIGLTDQHVRATGISEPATDGYGFAFRAHGDTRWTLPALVENNTLTPWTAAVLSVVVERGGAILIAGARGAGKTTLLGALLWELPAATRVVTIEDTPELPVGSLRESGRDVQTLYTSPSFDPETALRAALRLGEGALVVGEVRGTEAKVLYEAMRVGAHASAVLGTIHGDGAAGVRERVVTDLEVPPSSFATTDLVVTLERTADPASDRRLKTIEEVTGKAANDTAPIYSTDDAGDGPSGRIARGSSTVVPELLGPDEEYSILQSIITNRETFIEDLVADARTDPDAVIDAHARRRSHA